MKEKGQEAGASMDRAVIGLSNGYWGSCAADRAYLDYMYRLDDAFSLQIDC